MSVFNCKALVYLTKNVSEFLGEAVIFCIMLSHFSQSVIVLNFNIFCKSVIS